MRLAKLIVTASLALAAFAATGQALAAPRCVNTGDFNRWLAQFKQDALAQGISQKTLAAASPDMYFEESVIKRDSGQGVFQLTFIQFSNRLVGGKRIPNGMAKIQEHRALFNRIEKTYGVPAEVITAVWGLESDYGALFGKFKILPALTTLAYDCRRGEKFREELIDALKIIQRGDKTVDQMTGNWAGEFGGMQFTPSNYIKYGVDFDGDGHRDLVNSIPDTLASAANYLHSIGWRRGEPWLQEVKVPAEMPWQEGDLDTQHPRSQWIAWGVRAAHGSLPNDKMPASLILPMGRKGPAFLAYQNFHVFTDWNSSFVYATTVAYFATRLGGAPPVDEAGSKDIKPITTEQMMELQRQLQKHGFDVGEVDGRLGAGTRKAVRTMQERYGLPADSWPTVELIARLENDKTPAAAAPMARQTDPEAPSVTRPATRPVAKPPVTAAPEAAPRSEPRPAPTRAAVTPPAPAPLPPAPSSHKITVRVWTVQGCLTLRMSPEKAREYRRC